VLLTPRRTLPGATKKNGQVDAPRVRSEAERSQGHEVSVSHAHQSAMDFGVAEPVSQNTSRKGKNCAIAGLDSKEEQNLTVESCIAVSDGAIDADSRWFPRRWSADRKAAK